MKPRLTLLFTLIAVGVLSMPTVVRADSDPSRNHMSERATREQERRRLDELDRTERQDRRRLNNSNSSWDRSRRNWEDRWDRNWNDLEERVRREGRRW